MGLRIIRGSLIILANWAKPNGQSSGHSGRQAIGAGQYFAPARSWWFWVALTLLGPPAQADVVRPALVEISMHTAGECRIEIRASIEAMLTGINARYRNTKESPMAAEYDVLRAQPAEELSLSFEILRPKFLEQINLSIDGQRQTLVLDTLEIPEPGYTKVPRISVLHLSCAADRSATSLTWYYPEIFGDNAVRVRQVDEVNEKWHWSSWQWLKSDETSEPFSLTEVFSRPSITTVLATYIVAGYEHILPKGLDHILFILGIFLLSVKMRPLITQVTMFTVAHSITLGLAINGVINLPANIVEPLIALSIAYIGVENIWHRSLHKSRLAIVFAFGLLHGLGFASVLADFGMPTDDFLLALVSFNVGVELGQLSIIALAFLAIGYWGRNKRWYRPVVIVPGSALIAATGLFWTWQRVVF